MAQEAKRGGSVDNDRGPNRSPQVAHGACRFDTATGDVPDDDAYHARLEGNYVEPVAAAVDEDTPRADVPGEDHAGNARPNTVDESRGSVNLQSSLGVVPPVGEEVVERLARFCYLVVSRSDTPRAACPEVIDGKVINGKVRSLSRAVRYVGELLPDLVHDGVKAGAQLLAEAEAE